MPSPECTCPDCGEFKKEEYEYCYQCSRSRAESEGRLCDCGAFKKPEYDQCYSCSND